MTDSSNQRIPAVFVFLFFLFLAGHHYQQFLGDWTGTLPWNATVNMDLLTKHYTLNAHLAHFDAGRISFEGLAHYPHLQTLTYSDHLLGAAVLLYPLHLLGLSTTLLMNLAILLGIATNAWAAYLLLRQTGLRQASAFFGAWTFGFAAWWNGVYGMFQFNHLFAAPLLLTLRELWRLDGALRAGARGRAMRHMAVAALLGALQTLISASLGLVLVTGIGIGALWLWLRKRDRLLVRGVQWAVAGALIGIAMMAVAGPLVAPYMENTSTMGFGRGGQDVMNVILLSLFYPEEATWGFHGIYELLRMGLPGVAQALETIGTGPHARGLLPAMLPLPLIAWALLRARRDRGLRGAGFWLLLTVTGALLMAGTELHLYNPNGALEIPGPFALLRLVPGFSGLRFPVFFSVLVLLGLAGLTAWALERLARRVGAERQTMLWILLGILWLADTVPWSARPMMEIPRKEECPEVYRWLAERPRPTPVVELPIHPYLSDPQYQYFTQCHGQPILNGFNSYFPPAYLLLWTQWEWNEGEAIRELGARYVLLHHDRERRIGFSPAGKMARVLGPAIPFKAEKARASLRAWGWERVAEFDTTEVWKVPGPHDWEGAEERRERQRELAAESGMRLAAKWGELRKPAFSATSPAEEGRLTDGDPLTAWPAGQEIPAGVTPLMATRYTLSAPLYRLALEQVERLGMDERTLELEMEESLGARLKALVLWPGANPETMWWRLRAQVRDRRGDWIDTRSRVMLEDWERLVLHAVDARAILQVGIPLEAGRHPLRLRIDNPDQPLWSLGELRLLLRSPRL